MKGFRCIKFYWCCINLDSWSAPSVVSCTWGKDFQFWVGGRKTLLPYLEIRRASNPFDYEDVSLDYAGSCQRAIANLRCDPTILVEGWRKSGDIANCTWVTKDQLDPLIDSYSRLHWILGYIVYLSIIASIKDEDHADSRKYIQKHSSL